MTTDPFDMDDPTGEPGRDRVDDEDTADQHRAWAEDADAAEQERARRYREALGGDELERREQINYGEQYLSPAGECPVCHKKSVVGFYCNDEQDDDAIIGHCIICSYERTEQVASQVVGDNEFQRALDRD